MDNKGILICGEIAEQKLSHTTLELLSAGKKLSTDSGEELSVLLMGKSIGSLAQDAIAYGADKVYTVEDALLENYNSDAFTQMAAKVCTKVQPSIVLLAETDIGRDLAPRLNARIRGGLAKDCTAVAIDPTTKLLVSTRPVYGGNAVATVVSKTARPQMATLRKKVMLPAERVDGRQGQVIIVEDKLDPSALKVKVVNRVKEETQGVKLEDAEAVVAGGRGVGSAQNFEMVRALAQVLGGAVGGTRVAIDEGWLPATLQVGQTGKIVAPKLYIAVGLSGAIQHIAGILGSKYIVAVNKDPEANIFKVARFGIVGDFKEVLPALTEKIKSLKQG